MNIYVEQSSEKFNSALEFLKDKFSGLRSGRATADLVEDITIEAYGVRTPIKQMANISISDARTIIINPWDKSILKSIEKAISLSLPNINPGNEGEFIRVTLPPLTEENRKELVKLVKQKSEEARIRIRNVRDEVKEEIISAETNKEITEDDRFRFIKELDEATQKYNNKIKDLTDKKEADIMTV